jgi:hypothetical protein
MEATKECVVIHNRKDLRNVKGVEFVKGLCAADQMNPEAPRNYEDGLKRLEHYVSIGLIRDGRNGGHDDRKIRYSDSRIFGDTLVIYLGLTDWREYMRFYDMPLEKSLILQERSAEMFGGRRYEFHSRAAGATVMLKTREGSIPAGVRLNLQYQNFVHGPVAYFHEFNTIDSCLRLRKLSSMSALKREIKREFKEEVDIEPDKLVGEPEIFGVSCPVKTGEVDISMLQQTSVPNRYFEKMVWKRASGNPKEYKLMFLLHDIEDVRRALEDYRGKIYCSTKLILESLTPEDFKPLA